MVLASGSMKCGAIRQSESKKGLRRRKVGGAVLGERGEGKSMMREVRCARWCFFFVEIVKRSSS
jgi:hypothetical protein